MNRHERRNAAKMGARGMTTFWLTFADTEASADKRFLGVAIFDMDESQGPLGGGRRSTSALQPRRAHLIAAALAAIIIVPAGYVAYCMATLPVGGGLVIEPTPSALIVEAADGQVFATRGVFKGDKLSAQDVPANVSHAIIAIEDRLFSSTAGSICHPCCAR